MAALEERRCTGSGKWADGGRGRHLCTATAGAAPPPSSARSVPSAFPLLSSSVGAIPATEAEGRRTRSLECNNSLLGGESRVPPLILG